MTYYVVYIFEMANLTGNVGLVSSGVQYAIFIIGTAATFFFIDRTGRRPLLVSVAHPTHRSPLIMLLDLWRNWYGRLPLRSRRNSW